MTDNGLIEVKLDILTKRKDDLLHKIAKNILKASTIATTSIKGAAEGTSLISWIFEALWKKHNDLKGKLFAETLNNVTSDVICDEDFQMICLETALIVTQNLDIKVASAARPDDVTPNFKNPPRDINLKRWAIKIFKTD